MKEKVKRLLDLVRAGRLSLEDAGPLLAALSAKLALTDSDRELIDSLLKRDELDTGQVAEHLLLLRGVRDVPPPPPRPPPFPGNQPPGGFGNPRTEDERGPQWAWDPGSRPRAGRGGIEGMVDRITDTVERAVEGVFEGKTPQYDYQYQYSNSRSGSARILQIRVESSAGDEYSANLPVSLAPHLHKLIPPHGIRALESAGFSLDTLQLLIEADPPPGELISAEDSAGNEVRISLK
ncbi:hypothetical protein [Deinococcus marmoris]|uniref:Uncharacterized protein n=1 Tax=Deinococcus marmoris TaxID=249408 RepID=A0A1U7NZS6_9DEIO|nr:hypothetical protein [Deinococcus marmoris]OLV18414.1 hypothetical protein BOO71_0006337 [Deinococcus marmoris]